MKVGQGSVLYTADIDVRPGFELQMQRWESSVSPLCHSLSRRIIIISIFYNLIFGYRWQENQRQNSVQLVKPCYTPLAIVLLQEIIRIGENNGHSFGKVKDTEQPQNRCFKDKVICYSDHII